MRRLREDLGLEPVEYPTTRRLAVRAAQAAAIGGANSTAPRANRRRRETWTACEPDRVSTLIEVR